MRDIVIGLEDSPGSARALDQALREAASTGGTARAIHAWTTPVWLGPVSGLVHDLLISGDSRAATAKDLADELLDKGLSRFVASPAAPAIAEAREGEAGRVLVLAATDAALVVVGGRAHGYVTGALLGSATAYVLHHALCPVMVVPAVGDAAEGFLRVVVGMDEHPASRSALRWGYDAARRHGCPLVVVHSWLMTMPPELADRPFAEPLPDYETAARAWIRTELAAVASVPTLPDVHIEIRYGSPAPALLEEAGPQDLLVIGTRGRGGFAELVLGSVALQCAQHSRGTVVVVRAGQERLASAQ